MKINNKVLAFIFFGLVLLFLLSKTVLKPTERSFKEALTHFDPANVDKLTIQNEESSSFTLSMSETGWVLFNDGKEYPADGSKVEAVISEFSNLPTKQLVSRSKDKWIDYAVDDASAKRYSFYSGGKLISGLHVGRFNFNQQTRSGYSYARISNEDDIYSIEGFLSMTADRPANSFRYAKVLDLDKNTIESISLDRVNSRVSLSKSLEGDWLKDGVVLDSNKVQSYLTGLTSLDGKDFNDEFDNTTKEKIGSISVGVATVDAYLNSEGGFVMKSNQNEAFFNSDSTGIYKTVFLDFEDL